MTAEGVTIVPGNAAAGVPFEVCLDGVPVTLDRTVRPGGGFIHDGRLYLYPTDWWAIAYPGDPDRQLQALRTSADADCWRRLRAAGLLPA